MSEVKKFCRYCGSELSAGANFCPSCGKSHRAPTPPLQKSRTTVSVGVYILTIIIVLIAGGWIGAASKGPTVTPTVTVTQTIPGPTATVTATVPQQPDETQYKTSVKSILLELMDIDTKVGDKMTAWGKGETSLADVLNTVEKAEDDSEKLVERALRLYPPPKYAEAHVHIVKCIYLVHLAIDLYGEALTKDSNVLIEQGNALMKESTTEIGLAGSLD